MPLPFKQAPNSLCILRLSAIGDICHTLPIVRTIQKYWPTTELTWIIGKTEYALVADIKDINFIIFDKTKGLKAYWHIRNKLKGKTFDAMLHMQMSFRTSLISTLINTPIKLGFDKQRAKDGQWFFSNNKIPYQEKQHVIDSFFGFTKTLGIPEQYYEWNLPVAADSLSDLFAKQNTALTVNQNYVVISPCSSMAYRNWNSKSYAAIADIIQQRYNIPVILSGGRSTIELEMGRAIQAKTQLPIINLIAKTNLNELLSLLANAYFVISPDSGPAHMATATNTPVVGLYACTNPDRARPYLSNAWTVNRYPDAILKKFKLSVDQVKWGTRVRDEWAMSLISINDVMQKIDNLIQAKAL